MEERTPSAEFVGLVLRHQHDIQKFIRVLVLNRDDAEEILQETVTRLLEKHREFDPSRRFVPWALKFAHLEVLKHRSRQAVHRRRFASETLEALVAAEPISELYDSRLDALRDCLARLSNEDLQLLHAKYWFRLPTAELARTTGRTTKAVYRRLDRVRAMLLECVRRHMAQSER